MGTTGAGKLIFQSNQNRFQSIMNMPQTPPHVYDPGHDYHSFQYYILRVADEGHDIDLTDYYGGEAAGREDDRVTILTKNGRVITYPGGKPMLFSFEAGMYALHEGLCKQYPVAAIHGVEDMTFMFTPAEKVEQILSQTHYTDNGRGLNQYPQVAGRIGRINSPRPKVANA